MGYGSAKARNHTLRQVAVPLVAIAFAVTVGAVVSAQSGVIQIPKPPVAPKSGWVLPKTAWGDPDISGNFTNKYEQGTPMERPAGFEGRHVDDVRGAELRKLLEDRQRQSDERQQFLAGDPTGRIAVIPEFGDRAEIVKGHRAWMIIDPADGKIPAMTEEGAASHALARSAAHRPGGEQLLERRIRQPRDFSLTDRCITRGYPGSMLPAIYGDSYQIVQAPGYVAIRYEMIHETRIIPLDSRPHVSKRVRLDMGDARGRWDGNSLVVETTNFRDRSVYRNANPNALKITERFTRTAPDTVEWTVTIDDPTTWVRPWTFSLPLTMNDQRAGAGIRLPRGQLRAPQHAQRRARDGT